MKQTVTALLLSLIATTAFAQKAQLQTRGSQPVPLREPRNNLLAVDLAPLAGGGIGVAYDRFLSENFGIGLMADMSKMKSAAADSDMAMTASVNRVGAGLIVTTRRPEHGAWFLRGSMVQAQSEATMPLQFTSGEVKHNASGTGPLVSAGYMLSGRDLGASRFMVNLALNHGFGNAVSLKGEERYSLLAGSQAKFESEVSSATSFEVKLGLLF